MLMYIIFRWHPGYPYYVIAINLGGDVETIDLTRFENVEGPLTLLETNLESGRQLL